MTAMLALLTGWIAAPCFLLGHLELSICLSALALLLCAVPEGVPASADQANVTPSLRRGSRPS